MKITVKIKNLYGNEHIYPEDEAACIFARIAGHKTLKESKRDWEGV